MDDEPNVLGSVLKIEVHTNIKSTIHWSERNADNRSFGQGENGDLSGEQLKSIP